MKKSLSWIVLLVFSLAVLSACGGGGGGSAPAPIATGSFQLTNSTASAIDEVYVTLSSNSSWGSKQNTTPIPASSQWTLGSIPVGTYDSEAVIIGGISAYFSDNWGFPITAGNTFTTTATTAGFSGSLIVNNNNATYAIIALYISPTAYGAGVNQLSASIAPSSSDQIVGIPPGTYYVRAVRNSTNYDAPASIASISYTTFDVN
jgi:hypothetical protein